MEKAARHFDVAILGSGIGGAMLACILAKHGISVLLVEDAVHPRFAIGESLIPETGLRLQILGAKYGVPQIGWIGQFHKLRDHVSSNCGVKRNFSFCYHRDGEPFQASESNQFPTLTPPLGPDAHLFRQDTDAFMMHAAASYGAHVRQQSKITEVEFASDRVTLQSSTGEVFHCSMVVDAGGMNSPLAKRFSLRDAEPRLRTNTRGIYNHFVGIRAFDHEASYSASGFRSPFGQGTLHHVFDGGWFWVIPFNNHRESTNPLTSVGLLLDRRKHPEPIGTPEEEFRSFVNRFPSVARHFRSARAVRPWVRSGRLQYTQSVFAGPRWLQIPHAAAFIDPLYSSGLSLLTVSVDILADALLGALADNDYSAERFEPYGTFLDKSLAHYDAVIDRAAQKLIHPPPRN